MRKLPVQLPLDELQAYCRSHRIRRLLLFGSVLRDDFGPDSDIDLLVEFEPGTKLGLRFFTMERELNALLGRKVDLNTRGFLSAEILADALAEAEVLYVAA